MARFGKQPRSRGVALVLVLGMLVLLSGLVLAFFLSALSEQSSSAGYEKSASTRALAETALNVVIGQLQEATQRPSEAWVAQAGLIRTYNTSGTQVKAYKLYSSDRMVDDSGSFDPAAGTDLPSSATSWSSQPDLFADMNAPIKTTLLDATGTPTEHRLFPIIDPRAADLVNGQPMVEGFSFEAAWKSDTSGLPSLAMPVRWLYLLKDGTVSPGVDEPGGGVTIAGETKDNPSVGRFAFWTDDETQKINVNTASEGSFWGTPVANSFPTTALPASPTNNAISASYIPDPRFPYELDMAMFQARRNEFQRYPGHPSTTSLSPVLWNPIALALNIADPNDPAQRNTILDAIYRITPRVVGEDPTSNYGTGKNYTSKGGTQSIIDAGSQAPGDVVPLDNDRLYSSLDETLFRPNLSGASRQINKLGLTQEAASNVLEKSKFFLTANSRSPEVNLFNKPRVAVWPLTIPQGQPDSETRQTGLDKIIKLCSTVGGGTGKRYAFTRSNPLSADEDWSPRNKEIYNYLQSLTGQPIPGFGGNYLSKYAADRNQILTEIFDYIRCTNLADVSNVPTATPYTSATDNNIRGLVTPIKDPGSGSTRGFGRVPMISQVAISFRRWETKGGYTPYTENLEVAMIPALFSPMAGYPSMAVNMKITFSGLNSFRFKFGSASAQCFDRDTHETSLKGQNVFGGPMGTIMGCLTTDRSINNGDNTVPPTGNMVISPGNWTFEGGTVRIKIQSPDPDDPTYGSSSTTTQEFDVTFPATPLPKPQKHANSSDQRVVGSPVGAAGSPPGSPGNYYLGGAFRSVQDMFKGSVDGYDIFRSVVATGSNANGDFRLIAGSKDPGKFFKESANYSLPTKPDEDGIPNQTNTIDQGLRDELKLSGEFYGGTLVPLPVTAFRKAQRISSRPDVPAPAGTDNGVKNSAGSPGDWDNGPGLIVDGALLNKPDEGSTQSKDTGAAPYIGSADAAQAKDIANTTIFSPNRQIPSPVMFGSLSTGVVRSLPWQTLLFRPATSYLPGGKNHPGAATATNPADHLLLDLFWMPVVEPYPISEPFSTAGKVNLNYQIAPFTYITRKTGLHAVLKSTKITAINPYARPGGSSLSANAGVYFTDYKYGGIGASIQRSDGTRPGQDIILRREIDVSNTLRQIDELRFKKGVNKPFISASEICDIPLVPMNLPPTSPQGKTLGTINAGIDSSTNIVDFDTKLAAFWAGHKLTGDNMLEHPYALIYPRVTTKSNTFTVHVLAQRLATTSGSANAGEFNSARDKVAGEFRGSFVIERYLDPNSDSLVKKDGAGNLVKATDENDSAAFLGPYKIRVLSSKQLAQ